MEVYLLCIAIDGTDDRVAWSTFIVEPEGFVEEKSGLASSYDRAILWAIKEGLWGVPSNAHIAIRSTSTPVLRLGESTVSLNADEALTMENADLVTSIVTRAENQNLAWTRPPFLEAGDSRTLKIAQEIIRDPMSSYPPEEVDFIMQSYELHESSIEVSSNEYEEEIEEKNVKILQQEERPSNEAEEQPESKEDIPTKDDLTSEDNDTSSEDDAPIQVTKTYKPNLRSTLPPPSKKPQLQVDGPDYLFGARILAYVDGIGSGNLGAWSFVLVDRKTGFALARASGMRASTPYRARLIACIEVLSALKAFNQEIEIRSRWQKLIKLGDQWMHKWKAKGWKKSGNESIQEVGYIQQLDAICSQHRMSWLYIPDHNDEHGIQFCKHLVKNALNDINCGHKQIHSERLKDFPIDKLL